MDWRNAMEIGDVIIRLVLACRDGELCLTAPVSKYVEMGLQLETKSVTKDRDAGTFTTQVNLVYATEALNNGSFLQSNIAGILMNVWIWRQLVCLAAV